MAKTKKSAQNKAAKPKAIRLSSTKTGKTAQTKPHATVDVPIVAEKQSPRNSWLKNLVEKPLFRRSYAIIGFLVLVSTTILWAVLGAHLHSVNADQLADPYLFGSAATFHGATFPGAHSFLLKWPIFWLVAVFGVSSASLLVATVATVLLTVLSLAGILYKIDRRPLVFGTVCLFLSLLLLMVPTQPYAGALLPVNMAMLTTRNLEYIVYIAGLVLLIKARRFISWYALASLACLTLLIASDKLFFSLGLGGSLVVIVAYGACRNWYLVRLGIRWFCTILVATVLATLILGGLQAAGVTHFAAETSANPYALTATAKDGVLGGVYGVLGFLTNFGANPAYDATLIHDIPTHAFHGLFSWAGPAYVLALLALGYGLIQVWRLLRPTFVEIRAKQPKSLVAVELSVLLLASTLTAFATFVATQHYYAVDARYLAIGLFAVCIATVTALRTRQIRGELFTTLGAVAVLALVLALFSVHQTYVRNNSALSDLRQRSTSVAQALEHHKVSVLVGDYWRVLPAKFASTHNLQVMPFSGCTEPRQVLSSSTWQPDLHKTSFAYLLSLDGSLTDYPQCNITQVVQTYGRPNASLVISGTLTNPKELVLFYDHGINKFASPAPQAVTPATVLPIALGDLPNTNCDVATIMTVVAHQDDDLLFTSPDLLHDMQAGYCIRTVFLTAGDSGNNKFYWLNRQLGSEAAYDQMLGTKDTWVQRIVRLDNGRYITVANPRTNPKISLIFFNLPDGGIHGEGFPASKHQSLSKLYQGQISTIQSVDDQSQFTSAQLTQGLAALMNIYEPAEIHTQADVVSSQYPDHSDHIATGKFATNAARQYDQVQFAGNISIPVKHYIGYPVHGYSANVEGQDLEEKEAAFLAYAKYDGGVCQSVLQCAETPTYGSYINRQYIEEEK